MAKKVSFLVLSLIVLCAVSIQAATWPGKWIQAADCKNAVNTWQIFRKTVTLESQPSSCVARIAVDSKYWLWVNDELVVFEGGLKRGPSPKDTYYDEVELSSYLKAGENTIAVLTVFFGKEGFSHKNSGTAALLFSATCNGIDISSDTSWEAQVYQAYGTATTDMPNYRLAESAIRFDGAQEIKDWNKSHFEGHMPPAVVCSDETENTTFGNLVLRPIPQWRDTGLKDYVATSYNSNNRVLTCTLPYDAQVTPFISFNATEAGRVVDIRTDFFNPSNDGLSVHGEYLTRTGYQEYENLGWMSGNKVLYTLPEGVDVESVQVKYRETGYDADINSTFVCNDAFFNELWKRSVRTIYVNMRDTYFDCPDRERAQWWGDVVNDIQEVAYTMSPSAMLLARKGIFELIRWQRADGTIFAPIPAGNWDGELPIQMLMSVGWYGFYQQYYLNNDDSFVTSEIYDGIHRYLHEVWKADENGFVPVREGGWSWGDWGSHIDMELLTNVWYYLALKAEKQFALLLSKTDDAKAITEMMALIEKNFEARYWKGSYYASPDYNDRADDRANAMAVISGLASPEHYADVNAILRSHHYASPLMELYVQRALFQMGDGAYALQRAKQQYHNMLSNPEESTLWEGWSDGTHNHAWSSGMTVIFAEQVCGIRPTSPGFKTFDVKPVMSGLTDVDYDFETVNGVIHISLHTANGVLAMDLQVPEGTQAHVMLNDIDRLCDGGNYHFETTAPQKYGISGNGLITDVSQLSSNCTWDQQGNLANLLDGSDQTYWHSIPWTMDLTKDDEYIQVDLRRNDIDRFIMKMHRRNDIDDQGWLNHGETPVRMEVKATNDTQGEWETVATITGFPDKNSYGWPYFTDVITMPSAYRYIRLYCREATNTYWTFSELQLYETAVVTEEESGVPESAEGKGAWGIANNANTQAYIINFSTPLTCRYLKFDVSELGLNASTDASTSYVQLSEVAIYNGETNVATSASFTASSDIGNWGWYLSQINDGKVTENNGWSTLGNPGKVTFNADFGERKTIDKIVLYPRQNDHAVEPNSGLVASFPVTFTVSASFDGNLYSTQYEVSGLEAGKYGLTKSEYFYPTLSASEYADNRVVMVKEKDGIGRYFGWKENINNGQAIHGCSTNSGDAGIVTFKMVNIGTRNDIPTFQLRGKDNAVYVDRNFGDDTMLGWHNDGGTASNYHLGCDFNDDATVYLYGNKENEEFTKNSKYVAWWDNNDVCGIKATESSPSQKFFLYHLLTSAFDLDDTSTSAENVIRDFADTPQNYRLPNRTFSSSDWNTICLPFSLSANQIAASFGDNTQVYECSSVSEERGTVCFKFTPASTITAGKAYLIKPIADVTEPIFAHVTITATVPATSDGNAFVGCYAPVSLTTDGTTYILGDSDSLHKPTEDTSTINGFSAYFNLANSESVIQATIHFTDDATTIHAIQSSSAQNLQIYDLSGRKVTSNGISKLPSLKGLYIINGQKIVVK